MAGLWNYVTDPGQAEQPDELKLYNAVQTYGAQAVFGRVLSGGEVKRMNFSRLFLDNYAQMKKSTNYAEWVASNPAWAKVFGVAAELAGGENG